MFKENSSSFLGPESSPEKKGKLEQELPKWLNRLKKILNQINWREVEVEINKAYEKAGIQIETEYGAVRRGICDIVTILLGRKLHELLEFEIVPLSLILPPNPKFPIIGAELAHSALAVRKQGENTWYLLDATYGLYVDRYILSRLNEISIKINKENPALVVPIGENLNPETLRKIIEMPPNGYYVACTAGGEVVMASTLNLAQESSKEKSMAAEIEEDLGEIEKNDLEEIKEEEDLIEILRESLLESYYKQYSDLPYTDPKAMMGFSDYLKYVIGFPELADYFKNRSNVVSENILDQMQRAQKEMESIIKGEVSERSAEYYYLWNTSPTLKELEKQLGSLNFD